MNSINSLLGLYRTTILKTISILLNDRAFCLAITINFAIVFAVEVTHLKFYPYSNLPALFVWLGCASCTLHLIACALRDQAITKHEFIKGFSKYFLALFVWFMFVGISLVIFRLAATYSGYELFWILGHVIYFGSVLLPITELLYQSNIRGLRLCLVAFKFIKVSWLEWLIPHALLFGLYFLVEDILTGKEYPDKFTSYVIWLLFYGPFLNLVLIMRGVLLAELGISKRDSRMEFSHQEALNP